MIVGEDGACILHARTLRVLAPSDASRLCIQQHARAAAHKRGWDLIRRIVIVSGRREHEGLSSYQCRIVFAELRESVDA